MKKRRKDSKKKRYAAFLLAFFLVFQLSAPLVMEVEAANIQNPWDGESIEMPDVDEHGTYLIKNGAQLAWFATEVNNGHGEINGKLMNYIYLNDYNTNHNWIMIGDSTDNPYQGTFDGNGKQVVYMRAEISNKRKDMRYAGLFGVIDGGTVKNVSVLGKVLHGYATYGTKNSYDQFYTGSGGIAGYLKSGQIINCVNYARTTMDGDTLYRNAGGIAGINKGLILHCENQGKLSTIVGFAQNHIGGIAGLLHGATAKVQNCANKATVQGYSCVGGIAGAVKGGAEINASCNYGTIKGNSIIGGIAGRISTYGVYSNGAGKECLVQNVYSIGKITGYGTSEGSDMGGIAGQVGYESYTQEALPPMPVIQNAYAAVNFSGGGISRRGAIVGYMLSGCYGTVYGYSKVSEEMKIIGMKNDRAIKITGEALMVEKDELRNSSTLRKLGDSFTLSNVYDELNDGFPKLTWQGIPSDILDAIDEAQMELNSWLTANNQKKYGKNYSKIEAIVEEYIGKLSTVKNEGDIEIHLEAARDKLNKVKPAVSADSELLEAIDNGSIALGEYCKKLKEQHTELTQEQLNDMDRLLAEWIAKLDKAEDLDAVRLLIRDGKDALEIRVASYEEDKRIDEIRANAIQVVTDYRATEQYAVTWMHKIKLVRDAALEALKTATKAADVTRLMEQAKNDIDAIIDQVPEAGAWDGKTLTEPKQVDGVYQITSGSELAWFADRINKRVQLPNLSAELCNDISLGFKNWMPIGAERAFLGSFDGNGHVIRGLYIDSAYTYAGLFGLIGGGSSQVIQNLTVSGSISVDSKVGYAAGVIACIAGRSVNASCTVSNVHNNVSVTVEKIKTLDGGVGGVIGKAACVIMNNCSNTASVKILSESKGGITYYAGGLVGNAGTGTMVERSYNSGNVWSAHTAGGLAGGMSSSGSWFLSCYNIGEITGMTNAGGLCGNVINSGNNFNWCYTSGPVNLSHSGRSLGALFGTLATGKYGTLYALKRNDLLGRTLVGTSADFSATGKFVTEEELISDSILNSLNRGGNYFSHDYLGFQNGYPILSWQLTLDDFKTGAIAALKNYVKEADYTEENWSIICSIIANAEDNIKLAADIAAVNSELTIGKNAINEVETKAGTAERVLKAKKEEAVSILENYVDLTIYREEEQAEIRNLISNASKYIFLSETIEEVERHLNEARENIDRLPNAFQYAEQMNMAAAAQVDAYIMNIGEVIYTAYVKISIQMARNAYDGLTDKQKELVTTYQILVEAESAWAILEEENVATEEDLNLAGEVDILIDAIGQVTLESKETIEKARNAFNVLTEKQQTLVGRFDLLVAAEQAYDELCVAEVTKKIAAIGTINLEKKDIIFEAQNAYEALTEAQKKLVKAYPTLKDAVKTYHNLVAVEPVKKLISEIGEVTLKSANKITAAIYAYNKLTGEQQRLVANYDVLQLAAETYDSLVSIDEVIRLIDQIGVVSKSSEKQITAARKAYDALDEQEQKKVTNREALVHAEEAFKALQETKNDAGKENSKKPSKNNTTLQDIMGKGDGTTNKVTPANNKPQNNKVTNKGNQNDKNSVAGENENPKKNGSEDGSSLPQWLQEELENSEVKAEEEVKKLEEDKKVEEQKMAAISILGLIALFCAAQIGTFAIGFRKAAKKRKEKLIRYQ